MTGPVTGDVSGPVTGPVTGNMDAQPGWTAPARGLHWLMAVAIAIEAPAGWIMSRTYGARAAGTAWWQFWTSHIHHTLGLAILALAVIRLGWRAGHPPPRVPRPRAERIAAGWAHGVLYALLLLVPLSGWAALSALADSRIYGHTQLWFFGSDGFAPGGMVPRIVPARAFDDRASPFTYIGFARVHRWLLIAGAGVLALHIAAALRHHLVLEDNVLRRMWR